MERGERLVPVAFVGNLPTGETDPVMMSVASEQAKDDSAELVRHLAVIHRADLVFVIMDACGRPRDKVHRYQEILNHYGPFGDSPDRVDRVARSLETRHGVWMAQMPVMLKGAPKRTFGVPEFQLFTEVKGRFVDPLPVKEPRGILDDQIAATPEDASRWFATSKSCTS